MIVAAGLTPAWQRLLEMTSCQLGAVNRAVRVHSCASGKPVNVARVLHHLAAPARALVPVGGLTGKLMREDLARLGVGARFVEVAAETRICITVIESEEQRSTELVA